MCASFAGVRMCCCVSMSRVNVREFPQQEDETFDSSRKESSLLLSLMWSVCFSLFSFTSLLFLFSLFLIYRSSGFPSSSSDLFLCSCLSALCANRRICVFMCVWALVSWPYDYSTLRWGNTSRLDHTVRRGTVTWTCVFYPRTMAPRRCFNSMAEVQTPAWQSHPLETNQPPGYRVGMSGLLLSCFCLLENRIYFPFSEIRVWRRFTKQSSSADHLRKLCHLEIIMNNNRRSLCLCLCISANWMIIWIILVIYKVVYKKRSLSQKSEKCRPLITIIQTLLKKTTSYTEKKKTTVGSKVKFWPLLCTLKK